MDKKHITIESLFERFTGRTDDGKTVLDLEISAEAFNDILLPMAKLVKNLGFESMTYSWRSIPSPVPHEKGPMSIDEFIDWCVPTVMKHKTATLISIDSLKPTNLVTFSAHRDLGLEFETMDEIANELDITYGDTNSSGTLVSVETFLDSLDVLLELGLVEVGSHVHKVYEALAEWEKLNKGMGYVVF